jgi:hypothetical protein
MNPMRCEAIARLLIAKTHPDLAKLYTPEMEVQVLAAKDDGEMIKEPGFQGKEWRAFTDGFNTWKSIRIPYKANTEPEYEDKPISFSLEHHAEGIGMTGWNWKKRTSQWVAYDFDAIVGHSDKHSKKLTDKELEEVTEQLKRIPFSTLRLSTSGKGLHLYVFLDSIPTANHTEHAALARSVLSMLSGMVGADFTTRVDICGGNMWVWHRKMYTSYVLHKDNISFGDKNQGLKLIKQGEVLKEVPANWRDHVPVISRTCKTTIPSFVYDLNTTDPDKLFTELSSQRPKTPLDLEHKKLIEWLSHNNCRWWWDNDNWMLVTHTYHLKEAHLALKMRGKYETLATGSERGGDHNAFCFPVRGGAWAIRRYSLGVKEADTWEQDGSRWTRCYINRDIDLSLAARMYDGVEHEKGGFIFRDAESAVKALSEVGVNFDPLPAWITGRKTILKPVRGDNKLLVTIEAEEGKDDATKMSGWYIEKKFWRRIFRVDLPTVPSGDNKEDYNDLIRHVSNEEGADAGWMLRREGHWCDEPIEHIKIVLRSMDQDQRSIDQILGGSIINAWKLVNHPFQPEYPGNREWNRDAARFIVAPTADAEQLSYPTWQKVLENCGKGLDYDIKDHVWCKENSISNGADYLKLWLACMFKFPDRPTPYLAFWGDQDSGKSTFHEMLNLLFEGGTMGADTALTSKEGFNGELLSAILCIVEETSMKGSTLANRRIKDWVTSPYITIHAKNCTPYRAKNYTHWIQTANEQEDCPVFPGDTRITLIHVSELQKDKMIPKDELRTLLQKEAPDFLASVLAIEIPKSNSRLALPIIETSDKKRLEQKNMSLIEQFILEEVACVDGYLIAATEFHEKFSCWVDDKERGNWSKTKIGRELPNKFPRGRIGNSNETGYGNMTFDKEAKPARKLILKGMYLRPE